MQLTADRNPRQEGGVHTIGAPSSRVWLRLCERFGCGHVFGLSRGRLDPLAMMLSADPFALIRPARLTAQTMPRASGSIRFPAHHLMVTLNSCAARLLLSPAANPADARYAGISP